MNFPDRFRSDCPVFQPADIDPLLDGDVSLGLELKVTFLGIIAVVAVDCTLDFNGMRIVAFDQIAVVTVHHPYELGEGDQHTCGRSEEHTSELQSQFHLVCRLLLEKKKKQ